LSMFQGFPRLLLEVFLRWSYQFFYSCVG
jgi:hypothetical protein